MRALMSGGGDFQFAFCGALQHTALKIQTAGVFFRRDAVRTRWRAGSPQAVLPLSFASSGCTS